MRLKTSISDILKFDEKLQKITENAIIQPGSIFLLPQSALVEWGVGITETNIVEIQERAKGVYLDQLEARLGYHGSEQVIRPPIREWIEPRMARYIGDLVKQFTASLAETRDKILICDLPARDGITSASIALQMDESVRKISRFILADASETSLEISKKDLAEREVSNETRAMNDVDFLQRCSDQSFDVIVSLSHLHHKPFLENYLSDLFRVLKDDGVLVVGDRHSAIWDHPVNAFKLLRQVGADQKTLDDFEKLFGEKLEGDPFPGLSMAEVNAIENHFDYWRQIAESIRKNGVVNRARVNFLEASDTSASRIKKMANAGFSTDPADIRRAFPKANLGALPKRMLRDSDFSVVMAAVKSKS